MNTLPDTPLNLNLPLLSGGAAALLLGGIAIASIAMSAQSFDDVIVPSESPKSAVTRTGAATEDYKCAECGVIESTQKIGAAGEKTAARETRQIVAANQGVIESSSIGSYVITIRLKDGSFRTITDAHPAKWRPGERVTLIAGVE